jgi:type II secretory pathway pseudopilin PulG
MRVEATAYRTNTLRREPRGITLLEITVAAGILALLVSTSIQMLRVVSTQQRAADRHAVAVQTINALAEQLGNLPWNELTPEAAKQVAIPAAVAPHLPGAKLVASVYDEQDGTAAKRVAIELTWNMPSGQPAGPVRIISWSFPDELPPPE